MYKLVWKFTPKRGVEKEFEAAYGPHGKWVDLFRKAEGYIGSELLRDLSANDSYLTIDTWRSKADFDAFKKNWKNEYELLDEEFEALTKAEEALGTFMATSSVSVN